jgi:hypothetical protein
LKTNPFSAEILCAQSYSDFIAQIRILVGGLQAVYNFFHKKLKKIKEKWKEVLTLWGVVVIFGA